MTAPPIHVITPVWGAAYTRSFLEVGLASLLAPNNLPALTGTGAHLLHVFTTQEYVAMITSSPIWRRAQEVLECRVDIVGEDLFDAGQPHLTMSNCHRQAIEYADVRGAAMMFYNPDIVIADGGMRTLVRLLAQGKRAVQVLGLRLVQEDVVPLLMQRHADATAIVISPRDLMALAMKYLHPISMMHLHDAPDRDLMPQEIFWRVADEGIVARCFHIHPILVYPRVANARFTTTIDDDYLRAACPDPDDEYVIADSDEFCLCELSSVQRNLTGLRRTGDDLQIARWARTYARPHHLEHFCRRIFLHSGRTNQSAWEETCVRSDATVRRILDHLLTLAGNGRGTAL